MHRGSIAATVVATGIAALSWASPALAVSASAKLPPPDSPAAVAQIFNPALAPLGLHLTRAMLEAPRTYEVDPRGNHLALYVQPTGAYTAAQYRRNFNRVAAIFLPAGFRRWPGLASFDVCQEPLPSVDNRPEASPVTQLTVSRRGAALIRWSHTQLKQILAAERHINVRDLSVYVDNPVLREPGYQGSGTGTGA